MKIWNCWECVIDDTIAFVFTALPAAFFLAVAAVAHQFSYHNRCLGNWIRKLRNSSGRSGFGEQCSSFRNSCCHRFPYLSNWYLRVQQERSCRIPYGQKIDRPSVSSWESTSWGKKVRQMCLSERVFSANCPLLLAIIHAIVIPI